MLTNNGKFFFGTTQTLAPGSSIGLKAFGGATREYSKNNYAAHQKIMIGNSNTEPASSDYFMDGRITALTEISSSSRAPAQFEEAFMQACTTTYINNTDQPVTVNELGYAMCDDTSFSDDFAVLIARELIDPLVIQPGETFAFTMVLG